MSAAGQKEKRPGNGLIKTRIGGRPVWILGDPAAPFRVLQLTGSFEDEAGTEASLCREAELIAGGEDGPRVCLAALAVRDWDRELSPWAAPPLGSRREGPGFGGGGEELLRELLDGVLPELDRTLSACAAGEEHTWSVAGYSLAGLFALWAACRTDRFSGAAGVSPSLWFPGWSDFAAAHPVRCGAVYLSLGDREERARDPVLATVGSALRAQAELLRDTPGVQSVFELNPGNHFRDPEGRLSRAVRWLAAQAARTAPENGEK